MSQHDKPYISPADLAEFDQFKAAADEDLDHVLDTTRNILALVDGDVHVAAAIIAQEIKSAVGEVGVGPLLNVHLAALMRLARLPDGGRS